MAVLVTAADKLRDLAVAADALADQVITSGSGMGPWNHLTCSEAEALADVLRAAGRSDAVELLLDEHADGDDDPEDLHYRPPGWADADTDGACAERQPHDPHVYTGAVSGLRLRCTGEGLDHPTPKEG